MPTEHQPHTFPSLPLTLVSNIEKAYGEQGKTWLGQLPGHIAELAQKWNFRHIRALANLSFGYVALVELQSPHDHNHRHHHNSNHRTVILKTCPNPDLITREVTALKIFKNGVPEIYAFDESKKDTFLMEYIHPGHTLKTLVKSGNDDEATRIICQKILELQSGQPDQLPPRLPFKHLSDLLSDLTCLKGQMDQALYSKIESLFRDLTLDRSKDVLLHGDLHHDNILAHISHTNDPLTSTTLSPASLQTPPPTSWKVIDPHGYIGDPVAEVGTMIRNPYDIFPNCIPPEHLIERRLKILASELPFDPQRIKAWTMCMTLLSAAWNFQDFRMNFDAEIQIIQAIDRIKL